MGEPNFEGLDHRLHEQQDEIEVDSDKQRRDSAIADIQDIEVVATPPRDLIKHLDGSLPGTLCDQKMQMVWPSGHWKGLPITGYCDEPLCITEGVCTGTRFVPHIDQWTSTVPDLRKRRTPTPAEIIKAMRAFAKKAAQQTGRDEDRSDKEILAHVKQNWNKTLKHLRSNEGKWRQG